VAGSGGTAGYPRRGDVQTPSSTFFLQNQAPYRRGHCARRLLGRGTTDADWRFGRLDKPVGGFASREALHEAYAKASGRKVRPEDVHFWEVLGNVNWATGSVHQGERYLSGEETDIELIAIARRAVEMEYEALRLIEQGA
jgi:hypothetical protein